MKKQPAPPIDTTPPAVARPIEIPYTAATLSERYEDVYEIIVPDEVAHVRWHEGACEFECRNHVTLRVQLLSSGIVRLRYAPDGVFEPDFSYALSPDFSPEQVAVTLQETDSEYLLVSERLQVVVDKVGLRVKFYDADDRALCEDEGGFFAKRTVMRGWCDLRVEKKCHRKEVFLGLGDKACSTNLAGRAFDNWCTDAYAFKREQSALYRAIPFYYALHQGVAYGIFLDNTFRTHFDFGSEAQDVTRFSAEGGEMNYYFLYGPTLLEVSRAYAQLTGTHELPPMWALGYQQSKWSYYPEQEVKLLARHFREAQIPCDAIYLDIDYMDGFRCFTWAQQHFPEPPRLIEDLRQQGFRTVLMIDPGIKEDRHYAVYQEGMERGYFVRSPDGKVAKAPVWPGFCAFPDFTRPEVRQWFGDLYRDLYLRDGASGFWNDMNEPAVFYTNSKTLPGTAMHHYDGHPCSHLKAHNVYGQQMSRSSWEGLLRLRPQQRPFLLTRATYSGGQRYAAVWTGDNVADWEHLQVANVQCQRLAVSGFSFCGTDIGGFTGCTDGELYVRWLQLSVFHPLMRTHSKGAHARGDAAIPIPSEGDELAAAAEEKTGAQPASTAYSDWATQEPWAFGDKWTPLAKKAIELRYCMLPSLYTALWLNTLDGTPVLRHLLFADADEPRYWDHERDFLFGEHLLVSPVVQAKVQRQGVLLPKGTWYYFWTGQPGKGEMFVNVVPDQIPFFVREGAVLPVYPVRQWTGQSPIDELTLYVYYKSGQEISHLYEDAGEGYAYRDGDFSLKVFETEGKNGGFTLRQRREGHFVPAYATVKIYLVGFPTFVKSCIADGLEVPIKEIRLRDRSLYTLVIGADFERVEWKG